MIWEENIRNEMKKIKKNVNRLFRGFQDSPFGDGSYEEDLSDYRKAWAEFNETEKEYVIKLELPGVDKKDIFLTATDNRIEIRARKKQELEQKNEKKGFYSYSKSYAGFARSVSLPEEADISDIKADFENGMLIVKIPKKKSKKIKKEIKIN